jgi:hypothetical protein
MAWIDRMRSIVSPRQIGRGPDIYHSVRACNLNRVLPDRFQLIVNREGTPRTGGPAAGGLFVDRALKLTPVNWWRAVTTNVDTFDRVD